MDLPINTYKNDDFLALSIVNLVPIFGEYVIGTS